MTDSAGKMTEKVVYEAPELEVHQLSAIVLAGATGGGDSGFTGFRSFGNDDSSTEDNQEEDLYGSSW